MPAELSDRLNDQKVCRWRFVYKQFFLSYVYDVICAMTHFEFAWSALFVCVCNDQAANIIGTNLLAYGSVSQFATEVSYCYMKVVLIIRFYT